MAEDKTKSPLDRAQENLQQQINFLIENNNRQDKRVEKLERDMDRRIIMLGDKIDKLAEVVNSQGVETYKCIASFETTVAPFIQQTNINTENIKSLTKNVESMLGGIAAMQEITIANQKELSENSPALLAEKQAILKHEVEESLEKIDGFTKFFSGLGWKVAAAVGGVIGLEVLLMYLSKKIGG